MGLIQSILCSFTFCVERVLTWTCCAFLLMLIMFTLLVLMVYGISVGYHYAQKELASFAAESTSTPKPPSYRRRAAMEPPVVRIIAVNSTREDAYRDSEPKESIFLERTVTPVIILETERPPQQPELSPNEKEIAKKIIGRFRRSRHLRLRSLKNETNLFRFPMPIDIVSSA